MNGKKIDQNNRAIALNILYVPYNTKQIRPAYISKYNNSRDDYLAVKNISGLLRGTTSNHDGDFYCLNCFNSYTTEKKP